MPQILTAGHVAELIAAGRQEVALSLAQNCLEDLDPAAIVQLSTIIEPNSPLDRNLCNWVVQNFWTSTNLWRCLSVCASRNSRMRERAGQRLF